MRRETMCDRPLRNERGQQFNWVISAALDNQRSFSKDYS